MPNTTEIPRQFYIDASWMSDEFPTTHGRMWSLYDTAINSFRTTNERNSDMPVNVCTICSNSIRDNWCVMRANIDGVNSTICYDCWHQYSDKHLAGSCGCGRYVLYRYEGDAVRFGNPNGEVVRIVCHSCTDSHIVCDECGWENHVDDITTTNIGSTVCYDCRISNGMQYCYGCGYVVHPSSGVTVSRYGESCDNCRTNRVLSGYHSHHGIDLKTYGYGVRKYGIELEVENDNCSNLENDCRVIRDTHFADFDKVWFEHDGSINNGIEIITAPMSLPFIRRNFNMFEDSLRMLSKKGYNSHNTSTCGLHIHVSRKAFGETEHEQDAAITRMIGLVETYWDDIVKLSRRTTRNLNNWGRPYSTVNKDNIKEIVKQKNYGERYQAINITNNDTVEFRFFRGTLNPDRLAISLELANALVDFAVNSSDDDVFDRFATSLYDNISKYCSTSNMKNYFIERGCEV